MHSELKYLLGPDRPAKIEQEIMEIEFRIF